MAVYHLLQSFFVDKKDCVIEMKKSYYIISVCTLFALYFVDNSLKCIEIHDSS